MTASYRLHGMSHDKLEITPAHIEITPAQVHLLFQLAIQVSGHSNITMQLTNNLFNILHVNFNLLCYKKLHLKEMVNIGTDGRVQ